MPASVIPARSEIVLVSGHDLRRLLSPQRRQVTLEQKSTTACR